MMFDLGFAVKLVLAIDAKATEHIFHRQGSTLMWRTCGYRTRSDLRDCECAESGAKKTSQTWEKPLSKTVIAKHCLTLGYMNMDEKMFRADGK